MKQKDIAVIVIIVVMSGVISMVASNALFKGKKDEFQAVVVQPITTDFPEPDNRYFNSNAFDPTKVITIQKNDNTDPFSGSKQ